MGIVKRGAVGAAVVLASVVAALSMTAAPAQAAVWDCNPVLNVPENLAAAQCKSGFGTYRVAAECNSGHWPYTTTIYGRWVTKSSGAAGPISFVYADGYGCNVARAWVQVS